MKTKAAWYGDYYTNDSRENYSTVGYNTNFKAYNPNDCQDFVSQVLWYGFGGTNSSSFINSHSYPMIDLNTPGVTDWWADSSLTDPNWVWINVINFRNTVTTNQSNYRQGVQALIGDVSAIRPGDYIILPSQDHVYIVTELVDYDGDGWTDFNEIYYSSHSINRKHARLSTSYPSGDPGFTWMWVMGYQG